MRPVYEVPERAAVVDQLAVASLGWLRHGVLLRYPSNIFVEKGLLIWMKKTATNWQRASTQMNDGVAE